MKGVKNICITSFPIAMGYTFTSSKLFQITNSYRYQTNRKNQNFYRNTDFFFCLLASTYPLQAKENSYLQIHKALHFISTRLITQAHYTRRKKRKERTGEGKPVLEAAAHISST